MVAAQNEGRRGTIGASSSAAIRATKSSGLEQDRQSQAQRSHGETQGQGQGLCRACSPVYVYSGFRTAVSSA